MIFFLLVFQIALLLAVFGFIQRRLGDIDIAALHQLRHLAVEKSEQQRADMRAVHIGIGHDDDAVVAQLCGVEFFLTDAGTERGNQRGHFLAGKHFFKTGFFHIQNFALKRQNSLKFAVTALLGRAAGGVALDQIQFRERRIFFLAVGQLAGQAQTVHHAFAAGDFTRFARRFSRSGGIHDFAGDDFGFLRIFFQKIG